MLGQKKLIIRYSNDKEVKIDVTNDFFINGYKLSLDFVDNILSVIREKSENDGFLYIENIGNKFLIKSKHIFSIELISE